MNIYRGSLLILFAALGAGCIAFKPKLKLKVAVAEEVKQIKTGVHVPSTAIPQLSLFEKNLFSNQVQLAWPRIGTQTGFCISRVLDGNETGLPKCSDSDHPNSQSLEFTSDSGNLYYNAHDLNPGETYRWRVEYNETASEISVTTWDPSWGVDWTGFILPVQTQLVQPVGSEAQKTPPVVILSWNKMKLRSPLNTACIPFYRIYRGEQSRKENLASYYSAPNNPGASTISWMDADTKFGATYYYIVKPVVAKDCSKIYQGGEPIEVFPVSHMSHLIEASVTLPSNDGSTNGGAHAD